MTHREKLQLGIIKKAFSLRDIAMLSGALGAPSVAGAGIGAMAGDDAGAGALQGALTGAGATGGGIAGAVGGGAAGYGLGTKTDIGAGLDSKLNKRMFAGKRGIKGKGGALGMLLSLLGAGAGTLSGGAGGFKLGEPAAPSLLDKIKSMVT